ncbi:MAG: hypothetical protein AAGG55_08315 [Pseudomonadota bacterium]
MSALFCAMLLGLSACGGGGGSGGGFIPSTPGSDLLSYTVTLSIVDADGNPISVVTDINPATLRILVREDNFDAAPVEGVVAAATVNSAILSPANGQALTNAEGVGELQILAGDVLGADTITVTVESPAGTITATIGVDIQATGASLGFFNGTLFVPGQIGLSSDNIPFRGSAVVRVAVVDDLGNTVSNVEQIRFSSACSLSGLAGFREEGDTSDGTSTLIVDTVDGLVSAEYVGGNCETSDDLTAELIGTNATATASIMIAGRDANFIGYVTSEPLEGGVVDGRTIISLAGTGGPGRPEVATITFEVLEEAVVLAPGDPAPGEPGYLDLAGRAPLAGVTVDFALTSTLGGISLGNMSAVSDANGLVAVDVFSGNVATSTLVTATFDAAADEGIEQLQTATSNQIVIGTGLPDQNSVSMSSEVFRVPSARDIDGVAVAITVRFADKFNNPVADGTPASFTTEYGAIDSSCITGVSNGQRFQDLRNTTAPLRGTCTVLWISQEPRTPVFNTDLIQTTEDDLSYQCPSHTGSFGPCPDDLGAIRGFRSTVTVTSVGEEFFVDTNGNGVYDQGEPFENLTEAFTDDNEDSQFTPVQGPNCPLPSTDENCEAAGFEEEFFDFNGDGDFSLNVDPNTGEGVYNGSLCPVEGDGIFCSRDLVNVRADLVLTLSPSEPNVEALIANTRNEPDVATDRITEGDLHVIYLADVFNNAPGAGTTISLTTSGDCTLLTANSFTAPNTSVPGAFGFTASVEGDGGGGQLIVSAQDPASTAQTVVRSFPCVTFAPPDPNLVPGGT